MIRFLVFGDLHYDDVSDGDRRIEELVTKAREEKVDFIVSLGDLCFPTEENRRVIEKLNVIEIPVYHTIGNHDTEVCDINETLKFFSYEKSYYSFECGEYKCIVLDCCYWESEAGEFHFPNKNKVPARYPLIPKEEMEWLKEQISDNKKYIVFSHQSLINEFGNRGIRNREEILDLFADKDVILCMNGHDHGSDLKVINDTIFYTVNSSSHYCWWGGNPPEVKILPYKDALHAIVELEGEHVRIKGIESEYQDETPNDVGVNDYRWNGVSILPRTDSYTFDEYSVDGVLHCDGLIRVYHEGNILEQYINDELSEDEKSIALDFVKYLRDKNLTFYKDNCECWRDKIYYWVKYGEECVCFIAIKDPEEKDNHWTVWSADMGSELLAQCQVDEEIKEHAWKRVDHCGHCGSCGGGRTKVIFDKEFDDVCGCTFRIDNPDRMDLEVLKTIVDIRMKEIESK